MIFCGNTKTSYIWKFNLNSMNRILSFLLLTVIFTSCTPSAEDLIEDRHDDAQTQFDQFYKCYDIALETPPLKKDEIRYKDVNEVKVEYGESNVYQIGIEAFKELQTPLEIPFDGTRRREHADMAKLFNIDLSDYNKAHQHPVWEDYSFHEVESGESCRKAILHFLDTKFLMINRIDTVRPPKLATGSTYIPGYAAGDVLVFDVSVAKLLGGYTIEVQGSDGQQEFGSDEILGNVNANFEMKISRIIKDKFKELTPPAKGKSFNPS